MRLAYLAEYAAYGLDTDSLARLALLGDRIRGAGLNITGLQEPEQIEQQHFLDSLSLLRIPGFPEARDLADVGTGGGLPALVLAIALPRTHITAIESHHKKCLYIEESVRALALVNVSVVCMRAEEYGNGRGRSAHDVVVSRAVASLPVVSEYSLPLLRVGGSMVAMKGVVSDQERIQATKALGILGADGLEAFRLEPFEGALNRWAYLARKVRLTPDDYPRRTGMPAKRPLG